MMLRNRLWISSVTVIAAMAAVLCHSQPAAAQFTGGCCFPGGECVEGPADLCPREQGGTPVAACLGDRNNDGADDACAPPPPTGACCSPDGQCTAVTAEECKLKNGSYQGDSTECVPGLCVPPEGACCFADGTCKIVGREECAANNGQYQGDGTQCDPSLCVPLSGACCDNLTGVCADNVPESQCISVTGGGRFTWFGGLACDDPAVGCVAPTVACCTPFGPCQRLTLANCVNFGGQPSPFAECLGDANGNRIDDGCETVFPPVNCRLDTDTCEVLTGFVCAQLGGREVESCEPLGLVVIPAGDDLWHTPCGGATHTTFCPPIPPGFFGPGSDAFGGRVELGGAPFDANPADVDTVVQRLGDVTLQPGATGEVQIELTQLNLVSCRPIIVTFNGDQNRQLWDVRLERSTQPQERGVMAITLDDSGGGTFDATLPVTPRFTFTRQSDGRTQTLDAGELGLPAIQFNTKNGTFRTSAPADLNLINPDPKRNFFPGLRALQCQPDEPPQIVKRLTQEEAMLDAHGVLPPQRCPQVIPIRTASATTQTTARRRPTRTRRTMTAMGEATPATTASARRTSARRTATMSAGAMPARTSRSSTRRRACRVRVSAPSRSSPAVWGRSVCSRPPRSAVKTTVSRCLPVLVTTTATAPTMPAPRTSPAAFRTKAVRNSRLTYAKQWEERKSRTAGTVSRRGRTVG